MYINKFVKVVIGFLCLFVVGFLIYFIRIDTSDIRFAVANNSTFELRMMILKGADINQNIGDFGDVSPLEHALFLGHFSMVKLLVESGAKIDDKPILETLIKYKSGDKHVHEILRYLLDKGLDPRNTNKDGDSILHNIARYDYSNQGSLVSALSYRGILGDLINLKNNKNETALHVAARQYDSRGLISTLVYNGADITQKDELGRNPLQCAILLGNLDGARLLYDSDAFDSKGTLSHADKNGNYSLTMIINASFQYDEDDWFKIGRDVANYVDVNGIYSDKSSALPPLYAAVYHKNYKFVKLLLAQGAKVDDITGDKTPLMIAAKHTYGENRSDIVDLLLAHGADPYLRVNNGKSALEIATENPKPSHDIIEMMKTGTKKKHQTSKQ
ncbi:ankyrin repeat domain-containing protein [Chlamydiia bacterium]|nr:ankyrin repeat domain-containing protein [Chlamydiia bacterium]